MAASSTSVPGSTNTKSILSPPVRPGAKPENVPTSAASACSTRKLSLNRSLLRAVAELVPEGSTLTILEDPLQLPIFNSDLADPPAVTELKRAIAEADGVVFATPEYNYSIPGGLKNALDWISRPPATSPMRGKPVALCGAATGMSGTIRETGSTHSCESNRPASTSSAMAAAAAAAQRSAAEPAESVKRCANSPYNLAADA